MASVLNTGISALNAFKRQMETTGHNIANVNTEGYSRQRVDFSTRPPQISSQGYIGSGVDVSSIRREYDDYLALRVRDYTAASEEFSVYEQRARQIDNVIADAAAGIDGMLQEFFAAVNDVADDPTSDAARAMVLNRANQLSDRFNALHGWFSDIRNRLNQDLQREVNEINSLAQSLVEVNARIGSLNGLQGGIPPDILDERDKLLDQLSRYTSVSTVPQSDGMVNVFIGTGQGLVVGVSRNNLLVTTNPLAEDLAELSIQVAGGGKVEVTKQMTGGTLGGLLRFRDEVLDESHNALGRVAVGLTHFFNEEHRTGMDLDGELGGDFFTTLDTPQVLFRRGHPPVSGRFVDISELTTHEYQVDYQTGTGTWSMTDLTTGSSVALDTARLGAGVIAADPLTGPELGFELDFPTGPGVFDPAVDMYSYRIRPTRLGADQMGVLITNERDIAAAEYLATLTGTASGPANTGTGAISAGRLESLLDPATVPVGGIPPITITYDNDGIAPDNVLRVAGGPTVGPEVTRFVDSTGATVSNPVYQSGNTYLVSVPGLGTYSFTMTGSPNDSDAFRIIDNSGNGPDPIGVGDNRNARSLADLQIANVMIGGTATIADTYGTLVADVGTRAQQAQNNAAIQANLLEQATAAKSEVSGVNLDEEAADLVRFQQAYQAAAQVVSVSNSLFDSLLAAVRG